MKKIIFLSALLLSVVFGQLAFAQTPVTPSLNTTIVPKCADGTPEADCYVFLEALPGSDGTPLESINLTTTGGEGGLGGFINFAMEIGIGIAGVLGVVMLVIYGFQYAAEDKNVGNFTILKDKITKVVLGLMLLLGITIILRTINPDLLIVEPEIGEFSLEGVDPGFDGGYLVSSKLKASGNSDTAWIRSNSKNLLLKNKAGQTIQVRACDDSQNTTILLFGRNFRVHKGVVPSLKRIEKKWNDAGGNRFYEIPKSSASAAAMGAYNCRTQNNSSQISFHSYGLAVDINPDENPHVKKKKSSSIWRIVTGSRSGKVVNINNINEYSNMPPAFVKMWTDEGWGWGGNWKSSKDTMHFTKIKDEGGNMILD